MKKVLILAYDFPPYVSVGGLRPYAWYKYFHESDIYPIVVTRQWNNTHGNKLDYIEKSESSQIIIDENNLGKIIRTPYFPNTANRILLNNGEKKYKIIRKIISAYYEFSQWYFKIGPKAQLYFAANDYLKSNKVDLIIATGDPFILFNYASKLSVRYNIPWIADYRDAWTHNKNNSKNVIIKIFNQYFEKKVLKKVLAITTVSEFLKIKNTQLVKDKTYYIIPNGFDPEVIHKTTVPVNNKCLNIAYVGTIYKWHPLKSVLHVISDFLKNNKDANICINFYGINIPAELEELLNKENINIMQFVHIYPKIPNDLLLQKIADSNIMLLFNDYSISGTKIYDYLAINRKILLCYSNDAEALTLKEKYYSIDEVESVSHNMQEDIINETNSGIVVRDAEHFKTVLEQLYIEFTSKGGINCETVNIEKYSRKYQTGKLAEIIHSIS